MRGAVSRCGNGALRDAACDVIRVDPVACRRRDAMRTALVVVYRRVVYVGPGVRMMAAAVVVIGRIMDALLVRRLERLVSPEERIAGRHARAGRGRGGP